MLGRARHRPCPPFRRRVCLIAPTLIVFGLGSAHAQPVATPVSKPAAPGAAASAPPGTLQSVTVTADRQTENIKNVPVSVSTLSGEPLDVLTSGGGDLRLLSGRVPSLNIESSFGRAFPRFYIRGYGNTDFRVTASQPVSLIYDDVVQENPLLKGFPIFDLARVEVFNGPQGSLFGRNTPAGVVKFDSVAPGIGDTDGYGSVSFATYSTINVETAKSIPLGDEWAARLSGLYQHRTNYVYNTNAGGPSQHNEGYEDGAVRLQLLYKPAANFSALFNVHGRNLDGTARLFRANIIKPGSNDLVDGFSPDRIATDGRNAQNIQTYGSSARLRWDVDQYSLFSITGYETVHSSSRGDIDGSAGPYSFFAAPTVAGQTVPFPSETGGPLYGHNQASQEFRVESHYTTPLNWQAGLYYFYENFNNDSFSYDSLDNGAELNRTSDYEKNVSYAAFGSVKYDVTKAFSLRFGARYTHDTRDLHSDPTLLPASSRANGTAAHVSDTKPSGDLSAIYKLNEDLNVYARIASGYRGSSIQPAGQFSPQSLAGQESTVSYEAGVKGDLLDKKARVSFSVFRYTVHNLQLTEVGGGANSTNLLSAREAIGQGFELNLDAYLMRNLLVTAGGSYNYTQIRDPGLAVSGCGAPCTVTNPSAGNGRFFIDGNPLPQAPKWISNVTARYSIPFSDGSEYYVYTDWSYRSKVNFFLYNSIEFTGKALVEGGLRGGYIWDDGRYEVAVFGRNILNRLVATGAIDFNNLTGFINDPRTIGVQFRTKF